jgi:hypothetical protein
MTNDLRTEPFPTSIDTFYWRIECTRKVSQKGTRLSEPAKLTIWCQENTYKPLRIPSSPWKNLMEAAAGLGIDGSLGSRVCANRFFLSHRLADPEIGRIPLPVSSLPIRILISSQQRRDGAATATATATTNKSSKQETIISTFRLSDDRLGDVPTRTPLMQIEETVSFDVDKVITTTVPKCVQYSAAYDSEPAV